MSFEGGFANNNHRYRGKLRQSSRRSATAIPIPLEPLKEGHRINPQERIFLEATERGDKHTIVRCLQGPNPVNVNCTNILGRSAIQIAVDNENIEIVELLLKQNGVKIGDALLYAIREGVYRIVEMLIDHPSITTDMLGSDWTDYKQSDPGDESSDYSPDISPLILTAHCNQFEILQLLLTRGAKIQKPHVQTCSCRKCKHDMMEDSLRHSLRRINTYRALASPAWISLTSSDPILTAFRLSWELEKLAMKENEFKDIFAELSGQCKKYACGLLEQCRSTEEVIAVINKDVESDEDDSNDDEVNCDNLTLARLKLAIKYEQKQFVAHPHCQQLLASIWYEGLPGWRKQRLAVKVILVISLIGLMPLMAAYYLIFPRSKLGQLIASPFMKFMYHSATFGVFLFLLMLASTSVSAGFEVNSNRQQQRGPPPTALEWLILSYVTGFIWAECKQLWEEGLKAYVRQWWNWLDFIMLSLYLCTFSLRLVAFVHSQNEAAYGPNRMPRTQWPEDDPTLVSEGVFAVANVFSFARIIYLFQANQQLGPLQISLGCMLMDIGKFLFIFFLVLISFACGLNQLYYYYSVSDATVWKKLHNGSVTDMPDPMESNAFDPLLNSIITLFWGLFGLTQLSTIRESNVQGFTKTVGEYMLMVYHALAVIVLINMLIAMMSSSFQDIEQFVGLLNVLRNPARGLGTTCITLFWSLFGLVGLTTLGVRLGSIESFGKALFGLYNVAVKILLLNMLIAMMAKSFHAIVDHADREWKFARSKLWMGYFDQGCTLPPPFNLVISPKSVYYFFVSIKNYLAGCFRRKPRLPPRRRSLEGTIKDNPATEGYVNHSISGGGEIQLNETELESTHSNGEEDQCPNKGEKIKKGSHSKYQDVMRRLVTRYIYHWKKEMRQDGVNEDDLLEIKQDISSLRYELREDRKREMARTSNHMDTLKRDLLRSIRTSSLQPEATPPLADHHGHIPPQTYQGNFLTQSELDSLKHEIVSSLRSEIRDLAREMGGSGPQAGSSPGNPALIPPLNSELYHTHLYTQL